jgi:hypothetical protein
MNEEYTFPMRSARGYSDNQKIDHRDLEQGREGASGFVVKLKVSDCAVTTTPSVLALNESLGLTD